MSIKDSFFMIKERDMVFSHGQMKDALKDGGIKTNNMVLEYTLHQINQIRDMVFGN